MKKRDKLKVQAKELAKSEGQDASPEQVQLWGNYRKLRNSINNKVGKEEIKYKREKIHCCNADPSLESSLSKSVMNWSFPGPVSLEFAIVERVKKSAQKLKKKSISIDQLDNFSVKLASDC